jgi:3-methyladenine DNA glycosylase AlkD
VASDAQPAHDVAEVLEWLERHGIAATRDDMAKYAIPSDHAFGVSVGALQKYARSLGRSHMLAAQLWATGYYEARTLAAFLDDPALVTAAQMDRWSSEFDSWAICDTVCFHLFDRTPHAFRKVEQWARRRDEFPKRAAFALLWGLTTHDKRSGDELFVRALALVERAATDERNFVKKAVNMALRAVGKRNASLHLEAVAVAERLAASSDVTARWVGRDALRELTGPAVTKRLAAKG